MVMAPLRRDFKSTSKLNWKWWGVYWGGLVAQAPHICLSKSTTVIKDIW